MANLDTPSAADNLQLFKHRCEAKALLWQLDELSLHDAVDQLLLVAVAFRLDMDHAQLVMARAFAAVRDDDGEWRP